MYYKDITLTSPQAAIGYEDENLPTRVIIDISDLTKYGTGTTVLEVKRPCDKEAYIAEQTEVDGNNFYWYPTKGDLEVSGLLKCQVKAVIGDQIVKTKVYFVQVSGALNGDGTLSGVVPDALQTFVESVSGSESNAKTYASNASDSAMSAALSAASIKASADQIAVNKKALQTPTTVTDPTSKTVLLAGSQGIDYSKLADAIIAKYQGQTLAGKAQSVKSALDTVRSVQDQTIKTEDSSTPCSYSAGDFFVYDGKLYKASADFSSVTLTADNISQYAEAQTQTAINALNQSLFNSPDVLASNIPVIKAYPDNSTQSFGTCYKLWYWKVYSTVYVFFDIDYTGTGIILYVPIKGYRPYYTNGAATWLTVHSGANTGVTVLVRLGQMSKREVYLTTSKNAHIIGNFSYPAFD